MTSAFAVIVAILMARVGCTFYRLDQERAEARGNEILDLAVKRAYHEIPEIQEEDDPNATLFDIVEEEQSEIEGGQVTLWVVEGRKVLWQSQRKEPVPQGKDSNWKTRTVTLDNQTLIIGRPWGPEIEELRATARELFGLGFLVVAVTTALAWLLVGRTLSPIRLLAHQAQNSNLQGLSVRLESPSSDAEMRYLTGTLNNLLGRLEHEAQGRAQFYAAAAHELRTPIQILLGEIEVARSRPRSIAEHEDVLVQLQQGTERMERLVQDLLQLNALEMRQNTTSQEQINIAFWIERALEQQAAVIKSRSLSLDVHLSEAVVNAPPSHVEMLFRNLVENATKYATQGTALCVQLQKAPEGATLEITNSCELPGNAVQVERWFEPFFRPDASRSSQTGGNGLGLAICRALCTTNGWQISLQPVQGGVTVKVTFPTEELVTSAN